jgi:hypothetical protein
MYQYFTIVHLWLLHGVHGVHGDAWGMDACRQAKDFSSPTRQAILARRQARVDFSVPKLRHSSPY